ncbi:hypothetical protein [Leptolyngbya sp. O-77]|uniref:hypothetical protein n=1 Tax=Leptolyngbya sp. O-77 TaxID=1080068 RepID=UPI000A9F917E|nr:hypothetical protein [Leptolyngbya sp. O-77]
MTINASLEDFTAGFSAVGNGEIAVDEEKQRETTFYILKPAIANWMSEIASGIPEAES